MDNNIAHVCTVENLSGMHATMEMVLASLFDDAFTAQEYGLIANNRQVEYIITKKLGIVKMTARALAPCEPDEKFALRFLDKKFTLNKRLYKSFELDIIDFIECDFDC